MATGSSPALAPAIEWQGSPGRARRLARLRSLPAPVQAFLLSRVLVLVAGIVGSESLGRYSGWQPLDPAGWSWRLGSVGRVLAAASVRWDSLHYLDIAAHGYASASNTVFYPLYPLLVRGVATLCGSLALAGVLVSLAAFAVALVLLHRLTELELGGAAADAVVWLLAFAPLSLFFSAVYTESLSLALTVGCFLAARQGRWRIAVALAAFAAVTRVTGVLLVVPLLLEWWRSDRRRSRLVWLALVPAALACYLGATALVGYGFLAPFAQEGNHTFQRQMTGPPGMVVLAAEAAWVGVKAILAGGPTVYSSVAGPFYWPVENTVLFATLLTAAGALGLTLRRLRSSYGAYALVVLLVCLWNPVPGRPLVSFDRYTLTIFPLWMAAAAWLAEHSVARRMTVLGGGLLVFYTVEFAAWAFLA